MSQTDITIDIKNIEPEATLSVCQDLLSQMNNRSLHLICEATTNPDSTFQNYIIHAKLDGNAVFKHNLPNLTKVVNEKNSIIEVKQKVIHVNCSMPFVYGSLIAHTQQFVL